MGRSARTGNNGKLRAIITPQKPPAGDTKRGFRATLNRSVLSAEYGVHARRKGNEAAYEFRGRRQNLACGTI